MKINLLESLKNEFNFTEFRDGQREIIESIINGDEVVAILPTGGGKSLCYQLPALIAEKPSIVISPMISLMKDQVDKLNTEKTKAAFINSTVTSFDAEKILRDIYDQKIKILYLSPEKVESPNFRRRLNEIKWEYLFVDEAHCISEWGHNFRPSYRKIHEFAENLSLRKISAFTATATPEVRKDIVVQLRLKNPKIFVRGFARENLSLRVIKTNRKKEELLSIFRGNQTPAIVYCSTRKETEETSEFLRLHGYSVNHYHAGLSAELRKLIQDDFLSGNLEIITATNAFGMGIDKDNIRTIVHYNIPASIENYYQEIGRAGRDAKRSNIFLLYSKRDSSIHEYLISNSYPNMDEIKIIYNGIADYSRTALGSLYEGKIPMDKSFYNFFFAKNISKSKLENGISILAESGYLETSSPTLSDFTIRFLLAPPEMKKYIQKIARAEYAELLTFISKMYLSAPFRDEIKINLNKIARVSSISFSKVRELLRELDVIGIVAFNEPEEFKTIRMKTTRVQTRDLQIDFAKTEKLIENQLTKLRQMVKYADSKECRMNYILKYFGETKDYHCGICDNCLPKEQKTDESQNIYLSEIILQTLENIDDAVNRSLLINSLTGKSRSIKAMEMPNYGVCRNYSKEELSDALDFLSEKGKVFFADAKVYIENKEKVEEQKKAPGPNDYESELQLFDKLVKVRKDAAQKFNQPPYMICRDDFLREIVKKKPSNKFEFLAIKGANTRLWNKFGEDVISTIINFKRTDINDILKGKKVEKKTEELPENLTAIDNLLSKKQSLSEIANSVKLPESVVSMQIESLLAYKPETDISPVISKEKMASVKKLVESGISDLKEIKEKLSSEISYAEIRIILAKLNPSSRF